MRSASRVFYAIALFAIVACLLFTVGSGFDDPQGSSILAAFVIACVFLGYLLGRQARFDLVDVALPGHEGGEQEEIHLPGPSWYPALYGVAAGILVLGLAFSYTAVAVGALLLVATTVGWARESVADYRREVAHARPAPILPPAAAMELARGVAAFRALHHGADAVVQHVGRGRGEIVLVGADGAWGTIGVPDVAVGRDACALAGATVHASWPAGLGARVRADEDLRRRMAGASPFRPPAHHAPRDGTTQIAARVFLAIGIFAVIAAVLFFLPQHDRGALQGTAILGFFAAANFYLFVALRNAKAQPTDARYAGRDNVTREPEEPPAMDPATIHLPGPSWWPAVFSLAAGAVVLGLLFSFAVLWAGVALLVVSAVGWAVESVKEYRASLAGHH